MMRNPRTPARQAASTTVSTRRAASATTSAMKAGSSAQSRQKSSGLSSSAGMQMPSGQPARASACSPARSQRRSYGPGSGSGAFHGMDRNVSRSAAPLHGNSTVWRATSVRLTVRVSGPFGVWMVDFRRLPSSTASSR